MHQSRPHDPLVNLLPPPRTMEQLYTALTTDEARRVMQMAAARLQGGNSDEGDDMAKLLAVFTDYSLDPMLETWVERDRFWPPIIFRHAQATIRDKILHRLDAGTARPDHAMEALAWIGDENVLAFFRQCAALPPSWSLGFHIGAAEYSRIAGWELTGVGKRNLFFQGCQSITPADGHVEPSPSIRISVETPHPCPWCRRSLVNLLEIDSWDSHFAFLEWPLPRIEVLTCDVCTCFGFVYAELDAHGRGRWAPGNQRPKFLPDPESWGRSPWAGVPISIAPRRLIHAADWCLPTTLSQVGGLPAWVQDMAYPKCCGCGQTMRFLAQIDNAQFRCHEGVYYAFMCCDCRTTATTYQQT